MFTISMVRWGNITNIVTFEEQNQETCFFRSLEQLHKVASQISYTGTFNDLRKFLAICHPMNLAVSTSSLSIDEYNAFTKIWVSIALFEVCLRSNVFKRYWHKQDFCFSTQFWNLSLTFSKKSNCDSFHCFISSLHSRMKIMKICANIKTKVLCQNLKYSDYNF